MLVLPDYPLGNLILYVDEKEKDRRPCITHQRALALVRCWDKAYELSFHNSWQIRHVAHNGHVSFQITVDNIDNFLNEKK